MLKDYWIRHQIKVANAEMSKLRSQSNYVKLDNLCRLLAKLPHRCVDANIAALQNVRTIYADIDTLINVLRATNLKLETGGELGRGILVNDLVLRSLDSLFIANQAYIPFEKITVFLKECEKLVKLTNGIRNAKAGQDEYHFRLLGNLFTTCVEIQTAILENLQSGRLGQ